MTLAPEAIDAPGFCVVHFNIAESPTVGCLAPKPVTAAKYPLLSAIQWARFQEPFKVYPTAIPWAYTKGVSMISLTEDGYGKPVMWVPRGPTESPVFIDRVASGGRLDGSDADSQRAGLQRLLEDVMKIEEDRIWNAMYSMAGTGYGKPSLDLARVDEYDRWIESPRDPNFLMGQPEDLGIGISLGGYQFKIARNSAVVWHDSGATICASGTRKNVCRWRTYEEGEVV